MPFSKFQPTETIHHPNTFFPSFASTMARVDEISGFLSGPRARGAFVLRSGMAAPWALSIEDEAPLAVVVMVRGTAWVVRPGREQELRAGDIALIRGPEPYRFADSPSTPVQVRIRPGQQCVTPAGASVSAELALGLRAWGNRADGSTQMLIGVYESDGEISRRLTQALPGVAVLGAADWSSRVLPILLDEVSRDGPGQQVVLDRLLDLLVIDALRSWFGRADGAAPHWYAAQADPVVGPALRLLHAQPEAPWTVAALAARVRVSRAALARRFHDLVGEPPMAYLTGWRLALAADLLLDPGASVSAVSRRVGYASPFTFSTAFKRAYGHSPRDHRAETADRSALGPALPGPEVSGPAGS
jgi:AraC-like DNA-binding protein